MISVRNNKLSSLLLFISIVVLFTSCQQTNESPVCNIIQPQDGQNVSKGEAVTITVDATDNDGSISYVTFYVDDVSIGSTQAPPYSKSWDTSDEDMGRHDIAVTAIDDDGASSQDRIFIDLVVHTLPPETAFEATPLSGDQPLEVTFTDMSLHEPDLWSWDFGDGHTSTSQNPIHTYEKPGYYSVTLESINEYGSNSITKENYIIVNDTTGTIGDPCPRLPTVEYEGKTYNTVQIGDQCWLKENLNVGVIIHTDSVMADNDILERYCYDNLEAYCEEYGGLYQWNEMMQYSDIEGGRGICPEGWHIPSQEEWNILEGTVDSFYEAGNEEWNKLYWRGNDNGKNLKSSEGWIEEGNGTDLYGFGALPGGYDLLDSSVLGKEAWFWTSSAADTSHYYMRKFASYSDGGFNNFVNSKHALSVRCVRD